MPKRQYTLPPLDTSHGKERDSQEDLAYSSDGHSSDKKESNLQQSGKKSDCVCLDKPVSERLLNRFAEHIPDIKYKLGRELKVEEKELKKIQCNFHCANEQAYQILCCWKELYPEKATKKRLYKALKKLRRNETANKLVEMCAEEELSSGENSPGPDVLGLTNIMGQRTLDEQFFCHEKTDENGNKHIIIDYTLREDLPRNEQIKRLVGDMRKYLIGKEPLPCEEDLVATENMKFKENSEKINHELNNLFDHLQDLNYDSENLQKLQCMSRDLQKLCNASLEQLVFSKGQIEKFYEVNKTCNNITTVEKKYGEAIEKARKSGVNGGEFNIIAAQHQCREKQNDSLEKLLHYLIKYFSKGVPAYRWTWYGHSSETSEEHDRIMRPWSCPPSVRGPVEQDDEESPSTSTPSDNSHQLNSEDKKESYTTRL